MQENRQMDTQRYKRRHQRRKAWRNVVRVLACIVVFCTTYALILPAITMEKEAFCGIEAHVHEEACYGELTAVVCDPGEGPVIHTHDALCYSGETLICQLTELAAHTHGESCYVPVTLEAHAHGESCYGLQRGTLLCEIPEEEHSFDYERALCGQEPYDEKDLDKYFEGLLDELYSGDDIDDE